MITMGLGWFPWPICKLFSLLIGLLEFHMIDCRCDISVLNWTILHGNFNFHLPCVAAHKNIVEVLGSS